MKSTTCAVLTIILAAAMVQAAKRPKPKFCLGDNNIKYKPGQGYTEGCTQFLCVKKGKKIKMTSKPVPGCEDGAWSEWSSYSACSATCGIATKSRTRTCSNPAPANGGKPCPGLNQQNMDCHLSQCGEPQPDLAANVTSIENKMEALQSNVESLQNSVESILGMITAMQLTSSKLEVNITSNMDAIISNKKAISSNKDICSAIETTAEKLETCLGDFNSTDCPHAEDGKISVIDAIKENKENIAIDCMKKVSVMWMGSEPPFTTVTLPDFAPASPKCTIPWIPKLPTSLYEIYGVHYLFHGGYTAHAQVINGILYECDAYSCKSYDGEKWKLVVIDGKGIKLGTSQHSASREQAASVFIPGPQPKWIVHGGEEFRHSLIWTPGSEAGTGTWENYPDFVSPGPMEGVDLHCIVIIDGKVLQVGGRPWRKDIWGKWYGRAYTNKVFLGDVEVASLKEPRIYHTCAFFNNRTYVAGGTSGNHNVPIYGSVEIYDHTTDTWIDGPTLPFEIEDGVPKLKVIQGQLYYIGGNGVGKVFRLGDETWKDIADIPKGQKWIATIVEKTC